MGIAFVLLVLALVCFLVGAATGYAGQGPVWRINFVALGLAFWVAAQLFH